MTCTKQADKTVARYRSEINQFFAETVQAGKSLRSLALEVGLVKRSTSRIEGDELLKTLIEAALQPKPQSLSGLIDIMESMNPSTSMSVQALRQRLNTKKAEDFFELCLSKVLAKSSKSIYQYEPKFNGTGILSLFTQTIIEDCTEFVLHESLREHYKGSGGPSQNTSAMKLHTIWNYSSRELIELRDADRKIPDQQLAEEVVKHLKPGTLVIRDLGFYTRSSFEAIQQAKAFFLSRFKSRTHVYLSSTDEKPIELGSYLFEKVRVDSPCDILCYVFREKHPVRLVAFKANRTECRRREMAYLKECKKRKREPCSETLLCFRYDIFLTNVPPKMWGAKAVQLAYKTRWQVELLFKCWKSQFNLHIFTGTNIHRIRCLLYAKLIALVILHKVYAALERYAEDYLDKEVSLTKLVCWLQRENRIAAIIRSGYSIGLWSRLITHTGKLLSKEDNRGRQTTQQKLDNMFKGG